jgi:hypothetical protein
MADRGGTGGRSLLPEEQTLVPFVQLNEWLASGGTEVEFFDTLLGQDLCDDPIWDPIKALMKEAEAK